MQLYHNYQITLPISMIMFWLKERNDIFCILYNILYVASFKIVEYPLLCIHTHARARKKFCLHIYLSEKPKKERNNKTLGVKSYIYLLFTFES